MVKIIISSLLLKLMTHEKITINIVFLVIISVDERIMQGDDMWHIYHIYFGRILAMK